MSVALVTSVSSMLVYTSQASAELLQPQFFPSGNFDNCTDYYADNGIWVVWGGGVPLAGRQMTQYAYGAGFRGTALRTMVAIALGESHNCPKALIAPVMNIRLASGKSIRRVPQLGTQQKPIADRSRRDLTCTTPLKMRNVRNGSTTYRVLQLGQYTTTDTTETRWHSPTSGQTSWATSSSAHSRTDREAPTDRFFCMSFYVPRVSN